MSSESQTCFTCAYFTITPTDEKKRTEILNQPQHYAPAGMSGTCAASINNDAHVLHHGELIPLHEIRETRPRHLSQHPDSVVAQTPCNVYDANGQKMYRSLLSNSD